MFRWFKDRKKQRRDGGRPQTKEDDYGFKANESSNAHSEYGFGDNSRRQLQDQRDSPYHIYEEIRDLPDLAPAGVNTKAENRLTDNGVNLDIGRTADTGPYLVVPIIGKCSSENDVRPEVPPLCSEIPHGNKTCRCFQRNQTEQKYNEPWDTRKSLNATNVLDRNRRICDLSIEDLNKLHHILRGSDSVASFSSGSSVCSKDSRHVSHSEQDGNDTCCEYDMSTSSESDAGDNEKYNFYISKIKENLNLKHNVKKIIDDLDRSSHCRRNSDTDLESELTVSSLSSFSSQPTLTCFEVSDTAVMADKSESEDSSGYYECFDEKTECIAKISPVLPNKNFKYRDSHAKHKSKNHKGKGLSLDDEMYLLPVNKRTSCSDFRVYKTPIQALPPSSMYEDPYRARGRNHNRLLSDLIRMNYDRQLMV